MYVYIENLINVLSREFMIEQNVSIVTPITVEATNTIT